MRARYDAMRPAAHAWREISTLLLIVLVVVFLIFIRVAGRILRIDSDVTCGTPHSKIIVRSNERVPGVARPVIHDGAKQARHPGPARDHIPGLLLVVG